MTVRIPEFKKCCCCLPLRCSLLAWGYIKLIAGLFIIPYLGSKILTDVVLYGMSTDNTYVPTIIAYNVTILFCLILSMTDFVATIVFIVGGHKKNVKLIRGFYMFAIGDLIATAVLSLVFVVFSIIYALDESDEFYMIVMYAVFLECAFYIVSLVVKGYFVLLLRSELIKLESSGQIKIVNNSAEAEAQCTMLSEQNDVEKEIELIEE